MSENTPASQADIANFRSEHSDALMNAAHPLHSQRLGELSALYEKHYAEPADIAAPAVSAAEYREKHAVALNDRAHADHAVRVQELTAITERDAVGGNEPADSLPARPEDYNLDKVKNTSILGVELQADPELEQQARSWMSEGGLTALEGEVLGSLYAESLGWTDTDIAHFAKTTQESLTQRYGGRVSEVAGAALRVARENAGYDFLDASGLLNHWAVVDMLIRKAESKGYLK